jgi:3-methyladenine DNA glycosylase/8-oxoguanine DNA glycosylase
MAEPATPLIPATPPAADLPACSTNWEPGRPVDLRRTLGPLRHGAGDPAWHYGEDGSLWWATATPIGNGTLRMRVVAGRVEADSWGAGAEWLIERLPVLLGRDDDWSSLDLSAYPGLREVAHRHPGVRLPSSGRVLESLVPAALEQRVTGGEARRSWRHLLYRYGTPAPGPVIGRDGLRIPPDAATLLAVPTWDWHRFGVEAARQRPIRAGASVAARLERCDRDTVLSVLRLLPGVGVWTAAETAQRAFGHPDAVSVGDYHLHDLVVYALSGRARGDDSEMVALLEPWVGQRQRIVRLIELSGVGKPRFGPRYAPQDMRAI